MKLIIQIACFNEEETLPETLKALPRQIDGIDEIEVLVLDDGSRDQTVEVAKAHNVHHIIRHKKNQGLARSFVAGLNKCLNLGADIIVNTDADNQYSADDIPVLIKPILEGKADMVIGTRPISTIQEFSPFKKIMQRIGSSLVRRVSHSDVKDAPSGFRAISRNAALKLNVFNAFTYTHETIIQMGLKNMAITSVPIRVNKVNRPSRLYKSIFSYIGRSVIAILRMVAVYRPFRFFLSLSLLFFIGGLIFGIRYIVLMMAGSGGGHIQSVVFAGVLIGVGFQMLLVAFIADLLGVNRRILEEIQYRIRKMEISNASHPKSNDAQTNPTSQTELFSDF